MQTSQTLLIFQALAFAKGNLHPMDLKNGVAEYLIKLLEPARKHFNTPRVKKMKEELDSMVKPCPKWFPPVIWFTLARIFLNI